MNRIDEIKGRWEAATKGPWSIALGSGINIMTMVRHENPDTGETQPICDCLPDWFLDEGYVKKDYDHRHNMDFIAHAPEDIKYLLDRHASDKMVMDGQLEKIGELEAYITKLEAAAREYINLKEVEDLYEDLHDGEYNLDVIYDEDMDADDYKQHTWECLLDTVEQVPWAYNNLKEVMEGRDEVVN